MRPEQNDNPTGTTHVLTATLSSAPAAGEGPVNIDFEIVGVGDTDGGDTPTSPDLTCDVAEGTTACSDEYVSSTVGSDTIRAWIDHDADDATTEADAAEGRDIGAEPGDVPEPDLTDVVAKRWFDDVPTTTQLDCDPETPVNEVTGPGSMETFTCIAFDRAPDPDVPLEGETIDVENLGGANDPDDSDLAGTADWDDACTTDVDGSCTIDIAAAEAETGAATICFWVDADSDAAFRPHGTRSDGEECDDEPQDDATGNDRTDVVIKTWVALNCPGFEDDPRNQVVGTDEADILLGTPSKDILCGGGGADTIRGRGGRDLVLGGRGSDDLFGGSGNDQLRGGPGPDHMNGQRGRDRCRGGPGRDREVNCES